MKEKVFKVKVNDAEIELKSVSPTVEQKKAANLVRNKVFKEQLTDDGAILRIKLNDYLRKQKLWDDEKQFQYDGIIKRIREGEQRLLQGAKFLKSVDEAAKLAFEIKGLRRELNELISVRNSIDNITVDAQADDAYFNYLVSACTVYNSNSKPYFSSYNDYLNKGGDEATQKAALMFAELFYGINDDYENNLTENKFLKKWKFIDEKGRRLNKDGKLIDEDGKLVDEEGYYVNENNERVDKDGNRVDNDGNWILEYVPFDEEKEVEKAPE